MTAPTPRPRLPRLHRPVRQVGALMLLAVVLQAAAAAGMFLVAGPLNSLKVLASARWPWVLAAVGGLAVSLSCYYFGYRGVYEAEGGPCLGRRRMRAVVTAAFSGFLVLGGSKVDRYVLRAAGVDESDVRVRSVGLSGFEMGVLSLVGTGAAVDVLVAGPGRIPASVTWPWALAPLPGFVLAFWLAGRFRERPRLRKVLGGWVGSSLDAVYLIRALFRRPHLHGAGLAGMTGFWIAEMFAGWAGLAAFGYRMNVGSFILGFATGMVITRRTGPLAGAGLLEIALPLSLWYCGAPLAPAVAGTLLYRLAAVWPASALAASGIRTLKAMGQAHLAGAARVGSRPVTSPQAVEP